MKGNKRTIPYFLTGGRFETASEYRSQKQNLLDRTGFRYIERADLGKDVHDYVTAWGHNDSAFELIELCAVAAVLDLPDLPKPLLSQSRNYSHVCHSRLTPKSQLPLS